MITVGKKDLIVTYVSYFFRLTSNFILLPLILRSVTPEEYGLWNIYISMGSIINLLDVGISTVYGRYVTYAYCGAKGIEVTGVPTMAEHNGPNYELLMRLFVSGKKIYSKLFCVALTVMLAVIPYLVFIGGGSVSKETIIYSWLIYGGSSCLYIYYLTYNSFIKGMGKIAESQSFFIVQQVLYLLLTVVLLRLNLGILGLATGTFISTLVFRTLNKTLIDSILKPHKYLVTQDINSKTDENIKLYKAIKNNTKGLAYVAISRYITNYAGTLICSAFLSLTEIASLGLTNQVIGLLSSVSEIPFSTYRTKMNELQLNGKLEMLKDYYSLITVFSLACHIVGGLGVVMCGPVILDFIGSRSSLLPVGLVVILIINSFVLVNHQRSTGFIMLSNEQPHIRAYVASSVISLVMAFVVLVKTKSVWGYILPMLIVQLCYNAWKWPMEVARRIELKRGESFYRVFRIIYSKLHI